MPGPFPGMDPYIESREYWRGAHAALIARIAADLNAGLPDGFAASIYERLYIQEEDRTIYPDVAILKRVDRRAIDKSTGGLAVADPPIIVELEQTEIRESFIEVVALSPKRVITVIEILSHANKAAGSSGRDQYVEKQRSLIKSEQNLIEIDLLRSGAHTVATPKFVVRTNAPWHYLVSLHRGDGRQRFEFWPISIRAKLPVIRVPLTLDRPDYDLDLQTVFDAAYDDGPYRRFVDYASEPVPPLSPDDGAWADSLLRERGLRG